MKSLFKLFLLFGTILQFITAKQVQFFRKDYIYNETFDAFYKLHWNHKVLRWDEAFLACDAEGATIFYPKVNDELHVVQTLAGNVARHHKDNITDIFLGIHDKYGLGEYITVDGHSAKPSVPVIEPDDSYRFPSGFCVFMNIYRKSYSAGPCERKDLQDTVSFICKKDNSLTCPTIDQDYKLAKSLRKCYKINRRQKGWNEAMQTCYMEGGILTIIQNENEAQWLSNLLRSNDNNRYHVGSHRIAPGGDMYTIKGQNYDTVYQRELNNDEEKYDCGAIRWTGSELYTTTTECSYKLPFICEIEVDNI